MIRIVKVTYHWDNMPINAGCLVQYYTCVASCMGCLLRFKCWTSKKDEDLELEFELPSWECISFTEKGINVVPIPDDVKDMEVYRRAILSG